MISLFYGHFLSFIVCLQIEAFLFTVNHCNTRVSVCLTCERPGFYPEMNCNYMSRGDYCFTRVVHNSSGIFTTKGSASSSFCEANKYKSSLAIPACRTGNITQGTECIDCCKQHSCKLSDLYCNKHMILDIQMPCNTRTTTTTTTRPTLTSTVKTTIHGQGHHNTNNYTNNGHHHTDTTTTKAASTTTWSITITTPTITTTPAASITCSGNSSVVCEDDPKAYCKSLISFGLCTHLHYNPDSEDIKFCPRSCNLCDKYCEYILRTVPLATVSPPTFSKTTQRTTTQVVTSSVPITTQYPTLPLTSSQANGLQCPSCDGNLNCVGYQTCSPEEVCMIRSYPGTKFTTHCSRKEDCAFIKNFIGDGEIFCCNDRKCLSNNLGI